MNDSFQTGFKSLDITFVFTFFDPTSTVTKGSDEPGDFFLNIPPPSSMILSEVALITITWSSFAGWSTSTRMFDTESGIIRGGSVRDTGVGVEEIGGRVEAVEGRLKFNVNSISPLASWGG
jgi:hypothetical protein